MCSYGPYRSGTGKFFLVVVIDLGSLVARAFSTLPVCPIGVRERFNDFGKIARVLSTDTSLPYPTRFPPTFTFN